MEAVRIKVTYMYIYIHTCINTAIIIHVRILWLAFWSFKHCYSNAWVNHNYSKTRDVYANYSNDDVQQACTFSFWHHT